MATQLSITNRILKRLREDQVTTLTDSTYALLVSDFVADAYVELAKGTSWRALHHTIHVDLIAGTTEYDLSAYVLNGGNVTNTDARVCNAESTLLYSEEAGVPQVYMFENTSDDYGWPMVVISKEQLELRKSQDRNETNVYPNYVAFYPKEGTGDKMMMEVYPSPETTRQIKARFYTEIDYPEIDGSDETTAFILPEWPIFQAGLLYAYQERGEEIGEPGGVAATRAQNAFNEAIETEINARQRADTYDWRRD